MNRKALILSIPMILAVILLGGWFLLRGQKVAEESQVSPVAEENPLKNVGNLQSNTNIDTSNWKTYRNEKYGFEVKYPEKIFYLNETSDSDGGIYIRIGEKGYSIDDNNHRIFLSLNSLDGVKFSHCELYGTLTKLPPLKGKEAFSCYYNGTQSKKEEKENLKNYLSFSQNGLCEGGFSFIFDRVKMLNGNRSSSLSVGCVQGNPLEKNYKSIYDSIRFFSFEPSN